AGIYSVTVTDNHGCSSACSYTVTEPTALSTSCGGTNVACNGRSNGSAFAAPRSSTLAYGYAWSNGVTTSSNTGLNAGTYSVTVTDNHGCSSACSYTVTEPTALSTSCGGTNVTCNGGSNGSASVVAAGGTPAYGYVWSN